MAYVNESDRKIDAIVNVCKMLSDKKSRVEIINVLYTADTIGRSLTVEELKNKTQPRTPRAFRANMKRLVKYGFIRPDEDGMELLDPRLPYRMTNHGREFYRSLLEFVG